MPFKMFPNSKHVSGYFPAHGAIIAFQKRHGNKPNGSVARSILHIQNSPPLLKPAHISHAPVHSNDAQPVS